MTTDYLEKLNNTVEIVLQQGKILEVIKELKQDINQTDEPFVWYALNIDDLRLTLPANIRSGWIFVLKGNVASGCHYHPNSIQHMVIVEGEGDSCVDGIKRMMIQFGTPYHSLDDIWYVIDEGIAHEFFPERREMVVISFHTCLASELEEVSCQTGKSRLYQE